MSEVVLRAPFAGWFGSLDEVADPVFADRMMGDGAAIDPVEGMLHAPADGEVISVPETAHAVTLRLANGAELLIHVGLDTVALGGRGFTAHVAAGDRVASGDPLISVDLGMVAKAARDLVTPLVLPGEGMRIILDQPGRMVARGDIIARVLSGAIETRAPTDDRPTITREIAVTAPLGLHARPAARIVALLKRFDATVTLASGERSASAASTVALLALGVRHGDRLTARTQGRDAAAALDALDAFAAERFGDPADAAAPPATASARGGVCAAPGLAIGTIAQFRVATVSFDPHGRGMTAETASLDRAFATVAANLAAHGDASDIVAAHQALLDDPELRATARAALADGASAGAAWQRAIDAAAQTLEATGDARLAERVADLRDLEQQMLTALYGSGDTPAADLPPETILVADDLLPSQFLALDRTRLAGIVTARGGPTAHVALLAAAAGIPMVVAAGPEVLAYRDGATAILDADSVAVTLDPAPDRLAAARDRLTQVRAATAAARAAAQAPAATADGTPIEVFANLGSHADAVQAVAAGAEGCGLLRTEFLFLDRATAPDAEEQRASYAAIAAALDGRPLIVRTLDIGADKPVPYLPLPAEGNPALGQRGIRLSLARSELLATQLEAILAGVPAAQCRIMLPMVADVAELRAARAALDAALAAAGRSDRVELGVMIETPAAALIADRLAAHADFLSVGTNDLTQYTLAADRGNAAVAALVDPYHPAVLRLIALAAQGAATHGRWLGVCGGLASDPAAAALLIGLGVTELSAVSAAVPAVKAAVRATSLADAKALARAALAAEDAATVHRLVVASR